MGAPVVGPEEMAIRHRAAAAAAAALAVQCSRNIYQSCPAKR